MPNDPDILQKLDDLETEYLLISARLRETTDPAARAALLERRRELNSLEHYLHSCKNHNPHSTL
jgi:hypothetical protein